MQISALSQKVGFSSIKINQQAQTVTVVNDDEYLQLEVDDEIVLPAKIQLINTLSQNLHQNLFPKGQSKFPKKVPYTFQFQLGELASQLCAGNVISYSMMATVLKAVVGSKPPTFVYTPENEKPAYTINFPEKA